MAVYLKNPSNASTFVPNSLVPDYTKLDQDYAGVWTKFVPDGSRKHISPTTVHVHVAKVVPRYIRGVLYVNLHRRLITTYGEFIESPLYLQIPFSKCEIIFGTDQKRRDFDSYEAIFNVEVVVPAEFYNECRRLDWSLRDDAEALLMKDIIALVEFSEEFISDVPSKWGFHRSLRRSVDEYIYERDKLSLASGKGRS